jgi:hypothetical protein
MVVNRITALAARVLTSLGVACILLGVYLLWKGKAFAPDMRAASGTVVSYREVKEDDETRFRPRVRFQNEGGDIITFEGQVATPTQRFTVGETVPVAYSGVNAMDARINLFADNWLGATAALVIGVLSFIGGVFMRRAAARDPRTAS